MGDVFSGNVVTATGANAASSDAAVVSSGLLSLGSMMSPTALAGTNGKSVELVHGDVWDQFEGNDTKNVLGNLKLTISGDRKETVLQNHQHTIVGTTNTKHIGVHNHLNVGPRNDTFVHTRAEDHHQPEQVHQPTKLTDIQQQVSEYWNEHHKFSAIYWTAIGAKIDTNALKLEMTALEGKLGVIATKALVLESISKAMDTKYQAATTNFTLAAILASAIWAKCIVFDGNAGIAANADSPLG